MDDSDLAGPILFFLLFGTFLLFVSFESLLLSNEIFLIDNITDHFRSRERYISAIFTDWPS